MSSVRRAILSDPDVALRLVLAVPKDYAEELSELLLKLGVVEPIVLEPGSPVLRELEGYFSLLERARNLYGYLESNIEERTVVRVEVPQESVRSAVESLVKRVEEVHGEVRSINEMIASREAEAERLEAARMLVEALLSKYPEGGASLLEYTGSSLVVRSVLATRGAYEQLRGNSIAVLAEVECGRRVAAALAFSPEAFETLAKTVGTEVELLDFREYSGESLKEIASRLSERIGEVRRSAEELKGRKREVLKTAVRDIAVLKSLVESEYERLRVLQSAASSKYVSVITGWVPRSKVGSLLERLGSYPAYATVVEGESPPVDFNNPRPFRPFELITELYGMPSPHEWDPTPLLTYSFLLFFSLMMADIGYGLGIVLATRYLLPKFVADPESPGFVRLKKVLYACGALSALVGVASKSFLGSMLGWLVPLERPLINTLDIMSMIGMSLVLGLVFTFASHTVALAKSLKLRRVYDSLYEVGMLVLMVGGPFVVTRVFGLRWMEVPDQLFTVSQSLVVVGIALVAFSKVKIVGGIGSFLWLFDVVGIAGDVFSYVRIAGIACGTAFLAEAFNSILSGAVSSFAGLSYAVGIALGVVLALLLHTLNLALSAVSPFVHSLRLCLFEISSKFFEAQGRRIRPVKMVVGKVVV